jgi:acetyltransferase-like isoleucine patch superfamily enzyme
VESACIGGGTRIWAFAHVMQGASIGRNCNIGDHVFIESGVSIGDRVTIKNSALLWDGVTIHNDAFVGPQVAFTNDLRPRSPRFPPVATRYANRKRWLVRTVVGRGASIGCNATIIAGVKIGAFAMIGAGAVVTRDVPPHTLVLGVPARVCGYVCQCGQKLAADEGSSRCRMCGKTYRFLGGKVVGIQ